MRSDILKVAFRNVLKNKRRSILNMLTFSICVFVILYGFGMIKGQFNAIYERIIDLRTGHIKIYNRAYPDEKATLPLDLAIDSPERVISDISQAPGFVAASPRIIRNGIISNSRKKYPVLIHGIDLGREKKILTAYDNIKGQQLPASGAYMLAGAKLSSMLELQPGSTPMLFAQTSQNMNNLVDVNISGVYSIGFDAMEKINVYVPLAFAQEMLSMKGRATEIIIRLKNAAYVPAADKYIRQVLKEKYPDLIAMDWKQENADLFELARVKMSSFSTFIFIFLFLSFFIIVNTMTMSVFERTAEIGTLRAIGFDKKNIALLYMTEGFLLAFFGVMLGFVLSAPYVYYMNTHGMVLDVMEQVSSNNLPMTQVLKAANVPADWLVSGLVCIFAGVLGAYFPARMASNVNIVSSLKRGVR